MKKPHKNQFQDRLLEAMQARGYDHASLAKQMRLAWSTVDRWFSGSVPRLRTIEDIASTLRVRPDWLARGDGERDAPTFISGTTRITFDQEEPSGLVVNETSDHYQCAPSPAISRNSKMASSPIEKLDNHELLELMEGYPHMIASAGNDTVRHRLASDAEAAAVELKSRISRQ